MKFALFLPVVALSLDTLQILDNSAQTDAVANPIRKVVTMLQKMQTKIAAEGKKEEELYEKFVCYCQTGSGDLTASISAAEGKVPAVTSQLEETKEKLVQTKMELKQAQVDRAAAKEAMAEATALREKEAKAFAAEKMEYDTNIAALQKAIAALEKGMAGGFLQTPAAKVIRQLALSSQDMVDVERQELVAFLSGSQVSEYAPKSGEITGILKEILETMSKALADATEAENNAIESYEGLMSAKKKEVEALTEAIEAKIKSIGDMGVAIVQMEEDLSDTQAALLEDKKFLAGLDKSCAEKKAEWAERSKTRAMELVAIGDTIKVLNDDDALDLFKKRLPSAGASAFVQTGLHTAQAARTLVLSVIHRMRASVPRHSGIGLQVDLLAVALSGKRGLTKGGFDKVIAMCDNMINVLKQEQVDDDSKKEYCAAQLDQFDDKKKATERSISDSELAITNAEEGISTLTDEIKALAAGIKELDKSVMTATEQRKEENAEYKDLMASDTAAKELLKWAKNRLNKFYNPTLYVAPPKQELTAEERIYVNQGGVITTAAPGGIANTGITAFAQIKVHKHAQRAQDAPAPPPETWNAYSKKSQESTGVLAMLDLLMKDLDKEMTEAETEEKDSQAEYEQLMSDSAEKRTVDTKSLADKEAAKADLEAKLEAQKESKAAAGKELMATLKYIQSLHAECDWLLQYYDVRKEARAGEVDSLTKAKSILSGADFSLMQGRGFLRGSA